jgi:nitrate reductase (NAD(P)H)
MLKKISTCEDRMFIQRGGYLLNANEDWVKIKEEWPANVEKREKEEEAKKKKEQEEKDKKQHNGDDAKNDEPKQNGDVKEEHEMKQEDGENKHHDAYPGSDVDADAEDSSGDEHEKSEYEILREKYSPQEIVIVRSIQHEKDYMYNLKQNDGKGKSPVANAEPLLSIDKADQFSPDNWIPRSSNLIRLIGNVCLRSAT